ATSSLFLSSVTFQSIIDHARIIESFQHSRQGSGTNWFCRSRPSQIGHGMLSGTSSHERCAYFFGHMEKEYPGRASSISQLGSQATCPMPDTTA
ncbi:hypothetical protein H5410_030639, partial [Solanum commersonii]